MTLLDTFEVRWSAGLERGMCTGMFTSSDPLVAALWYHAGQADMARDFAAGQGASLAKLDAIEKAILNLAQAVRAAPVVYP